MFITIIIIVIIITITTTTSIIVIITPNTATTCVPSFFCPRSRKLQQLLSVRPQGYIARNLTTTPKEQNIGRNLRSSLL